MQVHPVESHVFGDFRNVFLVMDSEMSLLSVVLACICVFSTLAHDSIRTLHAHVFSTYAGDGGVRTCKGDCGCCVVAQLVSPTLDKVSAA